MKLSRKSKFSNALIAGVIFLIAAYLFYPNILWRYGAKSQITLTDSETRQPVKWAIVRVERLGGSWRGFSCGEDDVFVPSEDGILVIPSHLLGKSDYESRLTVWAPGYGVLFRRNNKNTPRLMEMSLYGRILPDTRLNNLELTPDTSIYALINAGLAVGIPGSAEPELWHRTIEARVQGAQHIIEYGRLILSSKELGAPSAYNNEFTSSGLIGYAYDVIALNEGRHPHSKAWGFR